MLDRRYRPPITPRLFRKRGIDSVLVRLRIYVEKCQTVFERLIAASMRSPQVAEEWRFGAVR